MCLWGLLFKARSTAQSIFMSGRGHYKGKVMNVTVVLWIVDDCQWKDSGKLLAAWILEATHMDL